MVDNGSNDKEAPSGPLNLEGVMGQYQSVLLRYATRLLNNADMANDVVQEAFIRLHANWKHVIELEGLLKPWLFRTTHNVAIDLIRKESRRKLLHQRQSIQMDVYASETESMDDQSARQALILQYVNMLKPKEREVLILRLQEEMSYKEIASIINRSEGYVGTLIHCATKKLSQRLRQAGVIS
jgi:RNA polymerase sigma-70 factor (ECF subfamily)